MLTLIVWWLDHALLVLLIVFAFRGKFLSKYPVFYAYVAGLLLVGLLRFYVYTAVPDRYILIYWYTQFLAVAGGYSVLWQAFSITLSPYPGTAKVARSVITVVFFISCIYSILGLVETGASATIFNAVLMERNIQAIQVILTIVLLSAVWYYRIPLGRNLRGLLVGYGAFIASRLIVLTVRPLLLETSVWWRYVEQIGALGMLVVWSFAFRDYRPNPAPRQAMDIDRDYQVLAARTAKAISRARSYLIKAVAE